MKKKLIFAGVFALMLGIMLSCKRKNTSEDDRKAAIFKEIMASKDDSTTYPGGIVIPNHLAQQCIDNYKRIYAKDDLNAQEISYAYTDFVSFGSNGLFQWMFNMADSTNVDNIRVELGVYTQEMIQKYPQYKLQRGRLAIFLWPYHGDAKAIYKKWGHGGHSDPPRDTTGAFDVGNLNP